MKQVFNILKKLFIPILLIVIFLVIQALLDLSLPAYTSDIVNTGITSYGIKEVAPKVIRESEYNKLVSLMVDEDKTVVFNNYTLITSKSNNYLKKYPLLKEENLYVINDNLTKETLEYLDNIFYLPIVITYTKENITKGQLEQINLASYQLENNSSYEEILNSLDKSLTNNQVIAYLKNEYEMIGIDTDKMQIDYIKSSGFKMLGVALLVTIVAIIIGYLSARVASRFGRDMSFSDKELKDFSIASLITRSTNDIQNVTQILAIGFRSVIYAPIMGIGAFIKVCNSTASMAFIVGIGVAAVLIVMLFLLIIVLPKTKKMQKLVDKVNLTAREILTGLPVIRTFGTEGYEEGKFEKANSDLTKTNLFVNRVMSLMGPVMSLIMYSMSILIIWFGAYKIDAGLIGVGNLLALIQYTMHVIFSFLVLSILSITLPRTIVSLKRIGEILDKEISVKDKERTKEFSLDKKGEVEFRNVSFRYSDASLDTLSNLSFVAKKGQTTAIIGSTGSGKSTLINLIVRFFDVTSGKILVDGIDIRDVTQEKLREKIGLVPQKGVLFSGTIDSNIRFGKDKVSDKEVKKAAEIAQALEFITDREDGFESPISQGGKNVSGGQKQRLAIARAILKNPEIYIFDDSFSALDFKTDAKLRKALKEITKEATVIIVTQRISTVLDADQIIVLDNGKVVGLGTHQELLKTSKVYQEIALSQLSEEELNNG